MQDGEPRHRLVEVTFRLREIFANRVKGINHDVQWPARSPDMTPCGFFLWGHVKSNVFKTLPHDMNELRQRICDEIEELGVLWKIIDQFLSNVKADIWEH